MSRINHECVSEFYRQAYRASNVVVSAAGACDHKNLVESVEKALSKLPVASDTASMPKPPQAQPQLIVFPAKLKDAHLCVGFAAYPQRHPNRYASYLFNTILGGGEGSRIFQSICGRSACASSAYSALSAHRDGGMLTIYANCSVETVVEALDRIRNECATIRRSGISKKELSRATNHIAGQLERFNSAGGRMSRLAREEMYFDEIADVNQQLAELRRVRPDDVELVANDLLVVDRISATLLGPVDDAFTWPSMTRLA